MNVVNNLEKIQQYLKFENSDQFYFIQIVKRRKENENLDKNHRIVKTFHINSKEQLLSKFTEIQSLCKFHNARAYIDLNRKSFEKTAYILLQKVADCLVNKTYQSIKSGFDSACGLHTIEKDKLWLLDIDLKNPDILENIIEQVEKYDSDYEEIVLGTLETLNGYHVITRKFNSKQAEPYQCMQRFDIHKQCNVLLYYEGIFNE